MSTVTIIGGGIAGLTTATALHRQGHSVTVHERAAHFAGLGTGVHITPNATRVLHRLGLTDAFKEFGVPLHHISLHRFDDDTTLARMDLSAHTEAPYYTIHREDLHQALLATLPSACVRMASECTATKEDADGVTAYFADQTRTRCDYLVAADGIHSRIRDIFQPQTPLTYTGMAVCRGITDTPAPPSSQLWLGPGQHAVSYPVRGGRQTYLGTVIALPAPPHPTTAAPVLARELQQHYTGWSPTVRQLIDACDTFTCWPLYDAPPPPSFTSRRTALAGDAAHSMLPFMAQGANQAIEDAAALANHLTGSTRPLAAYEASRRPRTQRIHQLSRTNSHLFHLPDGPEQQQRDQHLSHTWTTDNLAWLYDHEI
ncbi:FAD-dependent oxidoreductase [Streptomyces xanthochromogenes]|uniref:FAD-dependent oxidoreductase n=1 Tax=Streptomyces xanthochromogenes TaxID=67384 RepID=UPI00382CF854